MKKPEIKTKQYVDYEDLRHYLLVKFAKEQAVVYNFFDLWFMDMTNPQFVYVNTWEDGFQFIFDDEYNPDEQTYKAIADEIFEICDGNPIYVDL